MAEPILVAKGLTKEFKGFVAVRDLDLTIREGSIHAIIGPNGAGKSTVFNLLTMFLPSTRGTISFRGIDITRKPPAAIADMGLVRSFQISAVFPEFTVLQNVQLALQRKEGLAALPWRSDRILDRLEAKARDILDEGGLTEYAAQPASSLSYGRKRLLELMTTLALNPVVLLLDEPMAGMGAEDITRVAELIRAAGATRTIVMVEHNLKVVEDLCDFVTVLQRGELLAEGSYAAVSACPEVRAAYMGSRHG
jgi:branched-chain amino acid transport system ATP-binding protein